MHAALLKLAWQSAPGEGYYRKSTLVLAGSCGLITTSLGIGVAFIPSPQIESIRLFEIKMFVGTLFLVGLAAVFFFIYGPRKAAPNLAVVPAIWIWEALMASTPKAIGLASPTCIRG